VWVTARPTPNGLFLVLPPGQYTIQAQLQDQVLHPQSNRVPFALP
jgi:hypothetical protein